MTPLRLLESLLFNIEGQWSTAFGSSERISLPQGTILKGSMRHCLKSFWDLNKRYYSCTLDLSLPCDLILLETPWISSLPWDHLFLGEPCAVWKWNPGPFFSLPLSFHILSQTARKSQLTLCTFCLESPPAGSSSSLGTFLFSVLPQVTILSNLCPLSITIPWLFAGPHQQFLQTFPAYPNRLLKTVQVSTHCPVSKPMSNVLSFVLEKYPVSKYQLLFWLSVVTW